MSFKEIIGQEKAVAILQNTLAANRLAHAYLFEGPPSVGKVFTALNFAKAINCLDRPQNVYDCCDRCISCKKIDDRNLLDVSWLSPLKGKFEISIEQIRQVQQQINLKPYEARYKVFCIPDADMMTADAQNALLKTLEEPPLKSVIILTTAEGHKLYPTIVSRCQSVRFSVLRPDDVKDILVKRYGIDAKTAHFLAHISQSGIIDVSMFARDGILKEKNGIIDEFGAFLKNPTSELSFLKETDDYILWALTVILLWYRDAVVFKTAGTGCYEKVLSGSTCPRHDIALANIDTPDDIKVCAARYTTTQLGAIVGAVLKTIELLRETNVNPKLALMAMSTDIYKEAEKCLR
jgi:DNA polymerase-3 subunit delta'